MSNKNEENGSFTKSVKSAKFSSEVNAAGSASGSVREGFVSVQYLASNTRKGGRITKEIEVNRKAASVFESAIQRFPNNANGQVISVSQIAIRRNPDGRNNGLDNIVSSISKAVYKKKAGEYFDANSPRLNGIQNVTSKYNQSQGLVITPHNLMKVLRSSKILTETQQALSDFCGGHTNLYLEAIRCLGFYNVIVVTDGTHVTSENAKQKKIYLLHPMLTPGKHEECKQLVTRAPPLLPNGKVQKKTRVPVERPDCEHPDCTDPVATGGGGRFCRTHKPTHCTVSYDFWFTERYSRAPANVKSRLKWNKNGNGCGGKVMPGSGERFLCASCNTASLARRNA